MPRSSGAACTPISSVTTAPQSPPCATNLVYPRRFISVTQARDVGGIPSGCSRPAGEAIARHRWNHYVECVFCASAVGRGVCEGIDNLHLFDDRTGPPVRNNQRQRILVCGTDVNEMNVQS